MRKVYNNKRSIGGSLFLLSAFCFLLFVSCSQEEFLPQETDSVAVKISASIGKLQTRVSYDERNTTFDENDQIKVVNKLRTSKNVATYTLTDEEWNTADPFVWSSTSLNQFEAWYPVTDGTSFDTFTIPADQSSEQLLGAADWMTIGTKEIEKPSDKTLKLHFLHMLTKVTVNVTSWGSEYDGTDKTIEDVKIYSLATDIVQDREGHIGQIKTASLTPIAPLADGNSYTAIVCPGLYSSDQKFMTFTVNGTDNLTVLAKVSSPIEIEAAKHYTFNLTVGKDAATISSVEVIPWAKKEINGGVAEEIFPTPIDATSMNAEELNTAVTNVLSAGERYIEITMTATPEDELFTAIRRAICDTEGVEDGSINLILKGVTVIPDHHEFEGQGSSIFGQVQKTDGTVENVIQLSSVNLPDVLTIGTVAFLYCKNLTAVTAPKVQAIGRYTFYGTVLTSVNFPEAKTIDNSAFSYCSDIKEFNLPKVTVLGENALDIAVPDGEVTMYLTSADEIVVHKYCFHALEILENLDTKVNLVLNGNKRSQVNENTWTTKDADGNDVSFTFKSITFVGE